MNDIIPASKGEITLDNNIVRTMICTNPDITDQEIFSFIQLCKYRKLNPFLKEVFLIKYGKEPAQFVVSKDTFLSRAENHPDCQGWVSGVAIINGSGTLDYREGSLVLTNERLVGGWSTIKRKNWEAKKTTVGLTEYQQKKKDGTLNKFWSKMPGTMIEKIAIVKGIREIFPQDFGGMYIEDEMEVREVQTELEKVTHDDIKLMFVRAKSTNELVDYDSNALIKYVLSKCVEAGILESNSKKDVPKVMLTYVLGEIEKIRDKRVNDALDKNIQNEFDELKKQQEDELGGEPDAKV